MFRCFQKLINKHVEANAVANEALTTKLNTLEKAVTGLENCDGLK